MSDNTCTVAICDRPAGDAFVCNSCIADLRQVLAEVPWLVDELNLVLSRQTKFTTGGIAVRSSEIPLPVDLHASDILADLAGKLSTWTRLLHEENPHWRLPIDDPKRTSAWLMARLDTIANHVAGADLVEELCAAAAAGRWRVDRPAERQFLGKCAEQQGDQECEGSIYGRAGKVSATCDTCGLEWVAEDLRRYLIGQLEDRICTAAEIAELSTYLGLDIGREQVRKRINLWHSRGRLTKRGNGFRFGDAMVLLAPHDTARFVPTGTEAGK